MVHFGWNMVWQVQLKAYHFLVKMLIWYHRFYSTLNSKWFLRSDKRFLLWLSDCILGFYNEPDFFFKFSVVYGRASPIRYNRSIASKVTGIGILSISCSGAVAVAVAPPPNCTNDSKNTTWATLMMEKDSPRKWWRKVVLYSQQVYSINPELSSTSLSNISHLIKWEMRFSSTSSPKWSRPYYHFRAIIQTGRAPVWKHNLCCNRQFLRRFLESQNHRPHHHPWSGQREKTTNDTRLLLAKGNTSLIIIKIMSN